jgi:hypothetical protein
MAEPTLTVADVRASGSTVRATVDYPRQLRRFFAEDELVFEYDDSVADVPEGVLAIPALAQVAPVAWSRGVDVHTHTLDRTFLESLARVGKTLIEMYPEFMDGGSISCTEPVSEPPAPSSDDGTTETGGSGLLFSGGVDSLASYVRHREEDPTLISVHGWVVSVEEQRRWERTRERISEFAEARGCKQAFVTANMLDVLDTPMLHAHFKRYYDGSWYSSVGHGLGLLALCAPITYRDGLDDIYIAATHTAEFDEPWGSHPDIDDEVEWTGTRCTHDGYELSRQEKLDLIADYAATTDDSFTIRACTRDEAGGNCCACEKCYRTAIGVWLAGLDPGEYGYDLPPDAFERAREGLESGDWLVGEDERFMWADIQRHAADRAVARDGGHPVGGDTQFDAADFFAWLQSTDLRALTEQSGPPVSDRLLRTLARNLPAPVYERLYPIYAGAD